MQTLIHHSPLGTLDIPGVGVIEPGDAFSVDDDTAARLLEQTDLYSPAAETELTVPELRDLAHRRGVDITGIRRKADIVAALDDATQEVADPVGADPAEPDPALDSGATDTTDTATEGATE